MKNAKIEFELVTGKDDLDALNICDEVLQNLFKNEKRAIINYLADKYLGNNEN